MKYPRLDPPAFLDEFTTEQQRNDWSDEVRSYFSEGVAYNEGFAGVASQFYDPVKDETAEPFLEPLIEWPGFPKIIKEQFPADPQKAWHKAETGSSAREDYMDEYLEWHVVRKQGKIIRVSFTCETSQYYEFLARKNPAKLLEIYKQLVNPAFQNEVTAGDLIVGGSYRPTNVYNTEHGAVHLIQPNNNLYAEVMIAAQACIIRRRAGGTVITDSGELIECSQFGAAGRASDPKIGADVNGLARDGYAVSLRNPVALYITHWNSSGMKKPDGSPVGNYWRLQRGKPAPAPNKPAMGLHLVYEVPAAEGFVVGDIKIGNDTIDYGGQLAEKVRVGLLGLASAKGHFSNPAFTCDAIPTPGGGPPVIGLAGAPGAASPGRTMPTRSGR